MSFCDQCGNQLYENAKFCAKCGANAAGEAAGLVCGNCGAPLNEDEAFCSECGAQVGTSQQYTSSVDEGQRQDPSSKDVILKEGAFMLLKGILNLGSIIGRLFLYKDRLEFKGVQDYEERLILIIPINEIINVTGVINQLNVKTITKTYSFEDREHVVNGYLSGKEIQKYWDEISTPYLQSWVAAVYRIKYAN